MSRAYFRGPSCEERSFGLIVAGCEGLLGDFISPAENTKRRRKMKLPLVREAPAKKKDAWNQPAHQLSRFDIWQVSVGQIANRRVLASL